jgi:hypothetical protein
VKGFMSDELTIYINPEDDLTTVRERLEVISAPRLTMVIPPQTQLRSHVAWKLLYARAQELGKEVVIVSSDPQVRSIAHAVKFKVAHSLETLPGTGKSGLGQLPGRASNAGSARTRTSPPASSRSSSAKASSEPRSARNRRGASNARASRARTPEAGWHGDLEHLPQAEDTIKAGIGPLASDDSPKQYSPSYDFRIHTLPSIHPLSDQIEEPDLLVEDYKQTQDIRLAAREGQKRLRETDRPSETQPEKTGIVPERDAEEALPLSSPTQQSHTADNPFTDIPPQTEQDSAVSLEGFDTNTIEDAENLPDSVIDSIIDSPIEYPGDKDHMTSSPPSDRPLMPTETEQASNDEEQGKSPSRIHDIPPRRKHSSKLPLTSLTPSETLKWQLEEDALPPIEEPQVEPRSSRPMQSSISGTRSPDPLPPNSAANPTPRTSIGRGQQTQTSPIPQPAQRRLEPEATRTRTGFRLPHVTHIQTSRKIPVAIVIAILVLIAAWLLISFGPTAKIAVGIATRNYSKQVTLMAKVGQQAQKFSKVFTNTGKGTATGSQAMGTNPAHGKVVFTYSGSNPNGIAIPTGTIITTAGSNPIQFVTTAEVLVQPNASPPVSIQAVKSGEDGNVDTNTITVIPANTLKSIAQAQTPPITISDLKLSVVNEAPTTGGGAKLVPAVTDQDLTTVKNDLSQQLQNKINAWQQQLSSTGAVSTPQMTTILINAPKVNEIEASGTFPATIRVTATVLVVHIPDLQRAAIKQLNDAIKNDMSYAGDAILTDVNPAVAINQLKLISESANSVAFTFNATVKTGPKQITEEYIQQLTMGKSLSDARTALIKIPRVKMVDITVSPSFIPWVVHWDRHVNVTIYPAAGSIPHKKG